jgi:hypothetical protein
MYNFSAMKRLCVLVALSLTLPIASPQTGSTPSYQPGKIIDLRRDSTGSGAARAQGSFCLAVELGDMSYLVRYEAYWRWTYQPTDLVVGDSVEVRIKADDMYLKTLRGNMKTHIVHREKNTPGNNPVTCALSVATSN